MPHTKQFVALRKFKSKKLTFKRGQLVFVEPELARILVAQHMLMPLNTAVNEGKWPPKDPKKEGVIAMTKVMLKAKEPPQKPEPPKSPTTKSLIGNKLREAVQKSKAAKKPPAPKKPPKPKGIDAAKLAAIKAGGKK